MSRKKAREDVGTAGDTFVTWKRAIVQKFTGRSGLELERWPEKSLDHVLHVMVQEGFMADNGEVHPACPECAHSMKFHDGTGCTKTEELYGKHIYCTCGEATP